MDLFTSLNRNQSMEPSTRRLPQQEPQAKIYHIYNPDVTLKGSNANQTSLIAAQPPVNQPILLLIAAFDQLQICLLNQILQLHLILQLAQNLQPIAILQ